MAHPREERPLKRRLSGPRAWLLAAGMAAASGAFVAPSTPARADELAPAELDRLRKRFREAIALEQDERWEEALAVFEEVAKAKSSPQVRFHVALCQENLGRLVDALSGFEAALELAKAEPEAAKDVLENAPARIEALGARVPTLVVRVATGLGGEVLLDGEVLDPSRFGKPLRLAPGTHRLATRSGGEERLVRSVELREGTRESVEVSPAPPREDAPPRPAPKPATESVPGTKVPAIVVGSLGIAALAGAGVMLGLRQSTIAEVEDTCDGPEPNTGCDPAKADVAEQGRTYEVAGLGLAGGGAALLGAAAVLWLTVGADRPADPSAPTVSLAPTPGGFVLWGTFH